MLAAGATNATNERTIMHSAAAKATAALLLQPKQPLPMWQRWLQERTFAVLCKKTVAYPSLSTDVLQAAVPNGERACYGVA